MLKVLLTSMGGLVGPDIIDTLRRDAGGKIYIVGVDIKPDAIGSKFADKFFIVPPGNHRDYIRHIREIVKKQKVNVIVPFSDEEIIALSKNKGHFKSLGVQILCNDYKTTMEISNKGELLTCLSNHGFPVPKFCIPKSISEIEADARKLGYPKTSFVIKPIRGRGGRGFTVVSPEINFFEERNRCKMRLEPLIGEIKRLQSTPDILLMEYLGGEEHSVDVLADNGRVIYAIPRKRINTTFGVSLCGEFDNDEKIIEMTKEIVKILKLNLISNVQFKCHENDSLPYITEINPRPGGTIALNSKAGVPLLLYGIRHAIGKSFPQNKKIKPLKFWRYYKEICEKK